MVIGSSKLKNLFKVYQGSVQLGDDLPYSGEASGYANSLPKRKPVV